ncbi:MAG TPA: hypothetical protein PLD25_14535 [Chloroflexota bacterium]|nr:hypothetical protein [Chloroflexota bacterium]
MESVVEKKEKPATEMTFLEELQDLFAFLHSLWGILAGVTLFFPLSAAFLSLIPVEYRWHTDDYMRGFGYFKPIMVITITTLLIIFVMFWLVSHRERFRPRQRKMMQRRALHCFAVGIFSLIVYLAAYEAVADITTAQEIFRGNPALIPYDLLLLVSYAGFFVSLTAAFMILGMIEYYGEKVRRTAV